MCQRTNKQRQWNISDQNWQLQNVPNSQFNLPYTLHAPSNDASDEDTKTCKVGTILKVSYLEESLRSMKSIETLIFFFGGTNMLLIWELGTVCSDHLCSSLFKWKLMNPCMHWIFVSAYFTKTGSQKLSAWHLPDQTANSHKKENYQPTFAAPSIT